MDNRLYYIDLYDYYGELLTDKQKKYFENYYFDNLTLAEVGENESISRNAVHKQIKDALKKLDFFEEKLRLYYKANLIREAIKDLEKEKKEKIDNLI